MCDPDGKKDLSILLSETNELEPSNTIMRSIALDIDEMKTREKTKMDVTKSTSTNGVRVESTYFLSIPNPIFRFK